MPVIVLNTDDCHFLARMVKKESMAALILGQESFAAELGRLADLFLGAPAEHVIRIVVRGGLVEDVERMPPGTLYEVQDFDICSKCGGLDPNCEWCKEYEI
jgi:hypothetical protein